MRLRGLLTALVTAVTLLPGSDAGARRMLLGGRSAAMGMATVATGADGAMPLLNPAGLARTAVDTLSLSGDLYIHQQQTYRQWFLPGGVRPELGTIRSTDPDASSASFDGMPTTASYLAHLRGGREGERHVVFGVSLFVPESHRLNTVESFDFLSEGGTFNMSGRDTFTRVDSRDLFLGGPSFAIGLGRFNLGAALFYSFYRQSKTSGLKGIKSIGGGMDFSSQDVVGTIAARAHGLLGVVGAQAELGPVAIGLSAQAPTLHLAGSFESESKDSLALSGATGLAITQATGSGDFTYRNPLTLRLGVAATIRSRLTIEADASLEVGATAAVKASGSERRIRAAQLEPVKSSVVPFESERSLRTVVNGALGVELRLSDRYTARLGFFTDLDRSAAVPESVTALDNGVENVSHLGWLLGLGRQGEAGTTDVGVGVSYGFGHAVILNPFAPSDVDAATKIAVRAFSVMFVLEGTLRLERLKALARR